METDKARILEKIRKCMALGSSGNEHEAAAGMRQARKLMEKYGLTTEHVELSELGTERVNSEHANPPLWAAALQNICARAFQCTAYTARYGVVFIGQAESAKVAGYTYEVLMRQIKQARKRFLAERVPEWWAPSKKKKVAQGYCEGWVMAVKEKVNEFAGPASNEREAKHDQFLREVMTMKLKDAKPKKSAAETDRNARTAAYMGANDGEKVQLHHAMSGAAQAPRLERG